MIRTSYSNGTPGNGRFWASTYTYNGKLRLESTLAHYNTVNTDAQIFEEDFSAVTGEEEGVGGLAPYVWNATTNLPSDYAYSISAIPALLNLGTGQDVKSSMNKEVPKEYHSITTHGEEGTYSYNSSISLPDFLSVLGFDVKK